jgi:hypothetical protein
MTAAAALLLLGSAMLANASAVGGPQANLDTCVLAYGTDVYHVTFYGGELAEVAVRGDGDTDLDLFIFDEFGNLIASDIRGGDLCLAQWYPGWTGTFRIEVRNLGGVYNRYQIATN